MTSKEKTIWYMKEMKANHDLGKVTYKPVGSDGKIKVGFIVNMPEVWDKERPVFESMMEDDDFEPLLIVTPFFDVVTLSIGDYGSEWDYFYGLYGEKYVIKAKKDGQYVDLQQFGFDYVFYQRPYEHYLPGQYHTSPVSRYARTCYIPYFLMDAKLDESYYKNNFFRYLQTFFCSTEEEMRNAKTASARKNVFLGYPSIEGIEMDGADIADKAVLYTPRWSEEANYGGTSFYKYKEDFLSIKETLLQMDGKAKELTETKKEAELQVLFRPHPLMFQNAIKTGRMTETEVDDYRQKLTDNGIIIDANKDYMKTFADTGILVTDYSAIILNYFLTGKPIVFCTTIEGFKLSEVFVEMFKSIYMAKDWGEVIKYVVDLRNGIDPLKEERLKCIEKIKCGSGSVEKIKNYLKQ